MTISRRVAWDGSTLAVNGGEVDPPDEALHNSAVVGSSNAPVDVDDDDVYDPGAHTIDEVLAHLDRNPDDRARVTAAEQDGKARTTLLAQLESVQEL